MRVIARKALAEFWERYPDSRSALQAWFAEVKAAHWSSPSDVKARYETAGILANSRVVFNIFRMEQQGLSQTDLVPMIGSASRVSEVLAGKRGLSLNMIRGLVRGLGMSADVLIGDLEPKRTVSARTERKKKDDGKRVCPPSSRRSSMSRGRRR